MRIGLRGYLKLVIPDVFWPFLRFFDRYVIYTLYMYLALKRFVFRRIASYRSFPPQSISMFFSDVNLGHYPGLTLEAHISEAGINYKSGRHSLYIETVEDINKINSNLVAHYPYPIGLKLIKSLELSSDKTPYYTSYKLAPASTWFSMYAVGSMLEQAVVSNLLNGQGVAPKVYDIIRLESGDGSWRYAYVVQPIKGEVVTGREGEKFIIQFKNALKRFGMKTISIQEHCDLRPPEFRHNIRSDSTGTYYVDIQNFVLSSTYFGKQLLTDTAKRTNDLSSVHSKKGGAGIRLKDFLNVCDIDLPQTTCVDVGMSDELLMVEALAEACGWCYGVRSSKDSCLIRKYLYYHSFCRFDILNIETLMTSSPKFPDSINTTVAFIAADNFQKYQLILERWKIKFLLIVGKNEPLTNNVQWNIVHADTVSVGGNSIFMTLIQLKGFG